MNFKVEKGVPVKPPGSGRPRKYPFADMEVGDSFEMPATDYRRVKAAAVGYSKYWRNAVKFSIRADGQVCRIWRIK